MDVETLVLPIKLLDLYGNLKLISKFNLKNYKMKKSKLQNTEAQSTLYTVSSRFYFF